MTVTKGLGKYMPRLKGQLAFGKGINPSLPRRPEQWVNTKADRVL